MKRYNPKQIEAKWQKSWEDRGIYRAVEDPQKPKRYVLEYFPYPSGAAMHVGHVRNYTIGDAIARWRRMMGDNVLHPMGWDAFGLPAENYAIKSGISPQQAIQENTTKFKKQLMQMGFGYDWSREINSSDPDYYKWTQWLFLLLFKKGLAYQKEALVNWDPVDKTVLANEQVIDGNAERSGAKVEKKALKQWFFKITDYADRLVSDLDKLNWSESIKTMQRNWIGKSTGAEIEFNIENNSQKVNVFTIRQDTQYGVTFMVLAPEHPLVQSLTTDKYKSSVKEYIQKSLLKSDIERQEEAGKQKTGIFIGAYAINPINKEKVPIWVADYVLLGYGTGAVMGVPGHDSRDKLFAEKYGLEIRKVYKNEDGNDFHSEGIVMNSDSYNGLRTEEVREKILADMVEAGYATERINYKIRDWLISRQRYWGAPIPIIHCPKDGAVPVPEKDLPVKLPPMESYEPSGDGRSPLARVPEFVNTTCPVCAGPAQRETDTMDGFACSSWYFLRFADPNNDKQAFAKDKVKYWLPVDDYIGGAEHAVMHLLYSRFWTKVMFDEGLITFDEPFTTLRNQGMILASDGRKMSKSWGNVIAPDDLIDQGYGADSIRIMELFIGPWDQLANWSIEGLGGTFRFLQRVWTLVQEYNEQRSVQKPEAKGSSESEVLLRLAHQTIARVSKDLDELGFNTAVSALMEMVNALYKTKEKDHFQNHQEWALAIQTLIQLLAPFAPYISEELWEQLGNQGSVHESKWPTHDPKYLLSDRMTIVVQVNGKVRANIDLPVDASEEQVKETATTNPRVQKYTKDKLIKNTIYVPSKLLNLVI